MENLTHIAPPLDLPIQLIRGATGRFALETEKTIFHDAIDLQTVGVDPALSDETDLELRPKVYSVLKGHIYSCTAGKITVSHQLNGSGYVSMYTHVSVVPDFLDDSGHLDPAKTEVGVGQHIGFLTPRGNAHVHFEIRRVTDPAGPLGNPRTSVGIDPTRLCYAFEERYPLRLKKDDPVLRNATVTAIGVGYLNPNHDHETETDLQMTEPLVECFRLYVEDGTDTKYQLNIPLYEPMTAAEQVLIDLARTTYFRGRQAHLRYRESAYFGDYLILTGIKTV